MKNYQSHINSIENDKNSMKQLLIKWANINTGSYNLEGLNSFSQELKKTFQSLPAETTEISLKEQEVIDPNGQTKKQPLGKALSFRKSTGAPISVLLCGHMDTVFPKNHHFQSVIEVDENTLNGPGVADLKGGLVVIHKALQTIEESPYGKHIDWEVLINPDEEIGSPGSREIFPEFAKRHDIGLIFEPSLPDGSLAGARKGTGNFSVVFKGKPAHVGRAHAEGRSAILALAKFITKIENLNQKLEGITVNVGKIEGGGPLNVVPDLAIGHFNIRIQTLAEQNIVNSEIKALLDESNKQDGISTELFGGFTRPPKIITKQIESLFHHYKICAQEIGSDLTWKPTGGCCDGNNFAHLGLPNLDTLGVKGAHIHSDKEFMLIDSLVERSKLTALFLMKLASGEISWERKS